MIISEMHMYCFQNHKIIFAGWDCEITLIYSLSILLLKCTDVNICN